ncbi:Os08g0414000 [Oryza sativa Japonica Group]|uniref:Os08g0414000 protein n=1 Tax=Oryza sativa subsp. japonica TaxID=39947 RepID=C7J5W8_ORYSJ|nr:Os08g0414000 [Oryza sativa Japonica Group]|eukprot:NP_001175576.1 Os08g0414000 [Oryza sativa Japonica Group]
MFILLFDHPSENREKPAFVARAFVAIVKLHKLCYSLSCLCVSDLGHFQHAREEDKTRILFLSFVDDAPPRPFHHGDVYQQVEVAPHYPMGFKAAAVAPDGVPPSLLRLKGWQVSKTSRTSYDGLADHAHWVDWPLRRRMPDLDGFGIGAGGGSPAAVVGKWYCPFMFIRDGERRLKDQVNRCMFYEMTLEQRWEEIYSCDNTHRGSISGKQPDDEVKVNVTVRRSTALLGGTGAVVQEGGPQEVDGVMWFRPAAPPPNSGAAGGVGVDMVVWEKMKWELERGGWVDGNGDVESIERVERREALGRYWDKPNGLSVPEPLLSTYVLLIGLSSFPMGGPPSYHHHSFTLSSSTTGRPHLCRRGASS